MFPIAPQPLSNLQHELLKLYATGISDEHLVELKDVIAKFLLEKAVESADKAFEQKGYNQETIISWLNED